MKMIKTLATGIAASALMLATPVMAQEGEPPADSVSLSEAEMAEFTAMMAGLFQSEPLTPEQEARVPAARAVVNVMMPDGFYGKMMGDMMDSIMSPILGMFAGPDMVLSENFFLADGGVDLKEAQVAEIAAIVDPDAERRGAAMTEAMSASMGDAFGVLEEPMREGLSRAYAARFDDAQLTDIANFFATPTGAAFATESVSIWSDPQVMQSMMSSMPAIMSSFGGMEQTIEEAIASVPKAKTFEELTAAEKGRLGTLLGMTEAELKTSMEEAAAIRATEVTTVDYGDADEGDWEE